MSYEIALVITIFTFCSYAMMQKQKLQIFASVLTLGPLFYFTLNDYSLLPYFFIGSFCLFTRKRMFIPFMMGILTTLSIAKLNLEVELLLIYFSLILLRSEVGFVKTKDFMAPLTLMSFTMLNQFERVQELPFINVVAPLAILGLWHLLYIFPRELAPRGRVDGVVIFNLFLLSYLLPLKFSLILGSALPYIEPQLIKLSVWVMVALTTSYLVWTLLRSKKAELNLLLLSLLRTLALIPYWSGVVDNLQYYLLGLLLLELIGRMIFSFLSPKSLEGPSDRVQLGLRLVLLGYFYQFSFLPGSLSSLVGNYVAQYAYQQTDIIWRIQSLSLLPAMVLVALVLMLGLNKQLRSEALPSR